MLSAASDSANAVPNMPAIIDGESRSSLSDVLPSVVATSEWSMKVTIAPASEVANAMQERLRVYRTERCAKLSSFLFLINLTRRSAPLCPPSKATLDWEMALTQGYLQRLDEKAALEAKQRQQEEQRMEHEAFASIARTASHSFLCAKFLAESWCTGRCEAERSELRRLMAKERRVPVRDKEKKPVDAKSPPESKRAEAPTRAGARSAAAAGGKARGMHREGAVAGAVPDGVIRRSWRGARH